MKKKEIRKKTDFSIFSIDKEHWKQRAKIWHEHVEWEMRTIDDALELLRWYLEDADTDCPFSCVELKRIANDLVQLVCDGTDTDVSDIRNDYRAILRYANYSVFGGIMITELVRLIDYLVEVSVNSQ